MVEFLSFTADEWGQGGVGGDSIGGPGCLSRLVQVLGGGGGMSGGGDETINPVVKSGNIGDNSGKAGESKGVLYSPLFAKKQIAPAENPPVPQTRIMGSPDARVAPETQPPVPLAGGMSFLVVLSPSLCTI